MCQLPHKVGLVDIDITFLDYSLEGLYAYRISSRHQLHNAFILDSLANLRKIFGICNKRGDYFVLLLKNSKSY